MIRTYLIVGALLALLGGVGGAVWWVMDMRAAKVAQAAQIASLTLQLSACEARRDNLLEDMESDDAIDRLPTDALRSVPDWWLRPQAGDGSVY